MQKVGCLLCMARQYFLCVKMALGSKRLDTPVLGEPSEKKIQQVPLFNDTIKKRIRLCQQKSNSKL